MSRAFLPERLRPRAPRRRSRRSFLLVGLLPATLALTPLWRVQAVDLSGSGELPVEVTAQLEGLVGRPTLAVSPAWVRRQLEVWPEVSAVEVQLELPGTLRITARPAEPAGSVPVGSRWHAVTRTGELSGAVDRPVEPVLEGVRGGAADLRHALAVAERIRRSTGASVQTVRQITPSDFEVHVRADEVEQPLVLHVRPEATGGERYWCERIARGEATVPWADLRWDDRIVLGGAG